MLAALRLVLLGFRLVLQARGDLPVHCLRHQVLGEWEFVLTEPTASRDHCGHKTPDREDAQPHQLSFTAKGAKTLKITLRDPNHAASSSGEQGNWTMVYDEGWEVQIGDLNYFAFSRFDLYKVPGSSAKKNVSKCDETMQGWYSDAKRSKFGCYAARKVSTVFLSTSRTVSKHAEVAEPLAVKPLADKDSRSSVRLPKEWHEKMVLILNQQAGMTWRAKVYDRWLGKTLKELNMMQGLRRLGSRTDAKKGLHRQTYLQGSNGNASKLPATWSWNDANKVNYLEDPMDQGECGSCYAVSGVRMLTARHRIAIKDPKAEPFSITYAMECSEYNQGCAGGYGFLIGKWSRDVGLVPESCAPYATDAGCYLEKGCMHHPQKRWRAANQRYVGGYYGATNEQSMMQELYEYGPVTAGFEPKSDFMFYSGGIYQSGTDLVHHDPAMGEWEKVDHGVLLVGWGQEKGVKYWNLQNSWGRDWGEYGGYFRMKRGENDSGVESVCEAADVVEDELNGLMVDSFVASP